MKKKDYTRTYLGYTLRPARYEDAESYYEQNFNPLDAQIAKLTGSKTRFDRNEVIEFFRACCADETRCDFLLIAPDGRIIGESVINEIDPDTQSANFRIGIFHDADCGHGIGSFAIRTTRDFAFEVLGLHRLELDVYSFNPRAVRAYEKAGFRHEGVLRDAIRDGDGYADDILMAILEHEWRELKKD